MVQATFLVAAFAAALAGTAMADGCKPGTIYCGVTFIKDGMSSTDHSSWAVLSYSRRGY